MDGPDLSQMSDDDLQSIAGGGGAPAAGQSPMDLSGV